MTVFPFEGKDGKPVYIDAPDMDTAMKTFQVMQQPAAPPPKTYAEGGAAAPTTLSGVAEQGGASLLGGTAGLLGMPGTIRDAMQGGLTKGIRGIYGAIAGEPPNPEAGMKEGRPAEGFWSPSAILERFAAGPTEKVQKALSLDKNGVRVGGGVGSGAETRRLMSRLTGGYSDRQPENRAEEYTRTIGEFLPSAVAFGGLNPASLTMGGLIPALGSETAGQVVRGIDAPRPSWMPEIVPSAETIARIGGAIVSPMAVNKVRTTITPNPVAPNKTMRLDAAKRFDEEGIPYTAGQKTASTKQQYRESETGGAPYAALKDAQQSGFNRAALKRLGVDADEANEIVMGKAHQIASDKYTALTSTHSIRPQVQLGRDLNATVRSYLDKTDNPAPIVKEVVSEIRNAINTKGVITGEKYQSLITRLRNAGAGNDPDRMMVTRQLRENLDDAMERSIAATKPSDLGKWKDARKNWRDLIAVEDTLKSGAGGTEGIISPVKLRQVTAEQRGARKSAQTGVHDDDLHGLAKAGAIITKPTVANSGTASRLWARMGGSAGTGAGIGGAIGSLFGPIGAGIGAGVGAGAGPVLSALKSQVQMSPLMQKYLGNQLLKAPAPLLGTKPQGGLMRMMEQGESAAGASGKGPRPKKKKAK